jgi:hypothetical protein
MNLNPVLTKWGNGIVLVLSQERYRNTKYVTHTLKEEENNIRFLARVKVGNRIYAAEHGDVDAGRKFTVK